MFILLHVLIALGSIGQMAYSFFRPSHSQLNIATGLIAATIVSGTYVAIATHSAMLSVCMTGLFYLGGMLAALIAARHKLARQEETDG